MLQTENLGSPREIIENTIQDYIEPATWEISDERRPGLEEYKRKIEETGPNIPASEFQSPPGTAYDITEISESTGIRCFRMKTDKFSHKVIIDNVLVCLESARIHDDISKVMFPYGFTTKDGEFKVTNVVMPLNTFTNLSKELYRNFQGDQIYNQNKQERQIASPVHA
jgi:hypothetical protein